MNTMTRFTRTRTLPDYSKNGLSLSIGEGIDF